MLSPCEAGIAVDLSLGAGAFLIWLDAVDLLDPDSDPLPSLISTIERLGPQFLDAMAGGPASTFESMELLDEFDDGGPPELPTIVLPAAALVRESAAAAPIIGSLQALVDYVGDGRTLTKTGKLKIVDARALVELMATGDPIDPVIDGRPTKTRTATELPALCQMLAWAEGAKIIRRRAGRLTVLKAGTRLSVDPVRTVVDLVGALVDLGPFTLSEMWSVSPDDLGAAILSLLLASWAVDGGMAIDEIIETLTPTAVDVGTFYPRLHPTSDRHAAASWTAILLARLELAGVAVTIDGEEAVTLTPVGVLACHAVATSVGYQAPVAPTMESRSAKGLLSGIDEIAAHCFELEARGWLAARPASVAVDELTAILVTTDDFSTRQNVLELLRMSDPDVAITAVEAVRATTASGSPDPDLVTEQATMWLVSVGALDFAEAGSPSGRLLAETMAVMLDEGGAEVLTAYLPGGQIEQGWQDGPDADFEIEASLGLIGEVARSGHHRAVEILSAIADCTTNEQLARAAREGLMAGDAGMGT